MGCTGGHGVLGSTLGGGAILVGYLVFVCIVLANEVCHFIMGLLIVVTELAGMDWSWDLNF
jgi:hypothetical protein